MFITLEGPDGSGKSSQIDQLAQFCRQLGREVLTTREPGGTPISNQVREILLNRMENTAMHPRTEILLFCSARAQLVEEVIRPSLEQGRVVISDRYADSTLAYQGYGHGYDRAVLRQILNFATGNLYPNLTFLLDLDVETGLRRRQTGGGEWNRLDAAALSFHQRVREGYLEMAAQDPQRWVVVDASQPPEAVQAELQKVVRQRMAG